MKKVVKAYPGKPVLTGAIWTLLGRRHFRKGEKKMFETHRSDINVFFFKNDEGMLAVEVFVSPKLQRAINKRVRRYEAALAYLGGDVFIRITSMKALLTGLIQDVEGRRDDLKIHRRLNQRYVYRCQVDQYKKAYLSLGGV